MSNTILGLHHITAIAGDAQRNYDFYSKVIGLRLVKKTVNFDDPGTYHFYFGDEIGSAGTILTFFPWTRVKKGTNGTGMATEIGYAVPGGSLEFWQQRFKQFNVTHGEIGERFGEQYLPFEDYDGLQLSMIVPARPDARQPWITKDVDENAATRGFHSVTLTVKDHAPTARVLTDIFGYALVKQEGNLYRFATDAVENASIVDIVQDADGAPGHVAGGTNHHVAFRVKDEEALMQFHEKIESKGLHITPKIDRNYFFSLYFREPGGVLFELATENPGFAVDEKKEELGTHLKLPVQYEPQRKKIETILPVLTQ